MVAHPSRQEFAERRFHLPWTPSRFDVTRAARMRAALANVPLGRVLDVGCYDGQLTSYVTSQVAGSVDGVMRVGVDVSHTALSQARERGVLSVRAQVETTLPFRDQCFDTVIAAEVIEHVFDTEAFLREMRRVLRSSGRVLVTTPNLVALSARAKLLLGKSPSNVEFDASTGTSGHIRYLTFDTLEILLRRVGLEPVGRWTNVAHFSVLGSSETIGRLRPTLGHTLISLSVATH